MRCSQFLEGITELALGKQDPRAAEHVGHCAECAKALNELKAVAAGFRQGSVDPPADVVQRAMDIRLPGARSMRLVRTSLSAAGARRRQADSFQSVYEGEGVQVRAMYTRADGAWHVMAAIAPPVDSIEVAGKPISSESGTFEFEAATLGATGFRVIVGDYVINIPPGSSQTEDGVV